MPSIFAASPVIDRPLWPPQARGIELAFAAERAGHKAIVTTLPTGGGKRTMLVRMARQTAEEGGRAILFTNRRIITKQASNEFSDYGIDFGVLASGYPAMMGEGVIVASVHTVRRRHEKADLPFATRVFIDEAHNHAFDWIVQAYREKGVPVHGFTATPVALAGMYDHLVIAGNNSELRACKALVRCRVYSPEHPSIKGVKRTKTGEFYQPQLRKMFATYQTDVFANVVEWWKKLNPWALPTLLWAPGVPESRWFVEELTCQGITAAHIDGETDDQERERILAGSKDGSIKIVCSYGVLREGGDFPWIVHGILIQVCGALSTYLQIVGRLLRKDEHKDECVLQDHSGAMWRHGSPNADRLWSLEDTDLSIAKKVQAERRQGGAKEPIRCPQCGGERLAGPKCPHCGHEHQKSVRMVRMTSGKLTRVTGNMVKVKRPGGDDQRIWMSCLYAAAARNQTVSQAAGNFHRKTGRWPHGLGNVPSHTDPEWALKAVEVYPWLKKRRGKS